MMSPERLIIARAVARLRAYVAGGGRPYVLPNGKLAIATRTAGVWGRGSPKDCRARERDDRRFFDALRHEDARRYITRAVRTCGRSGPLGHRVMGVA